MAPVNKILKYNLGDRVLALSGEGLVTNAIAEVITRELEGKDTISQPTVARWLKSVRKERSDATKQIFQEHIKISLPKDLEALEEIEAFLLGVFRNIVEGEPLKKGEYDYSQRVEAGMKAVRIIETKLRFSGVLDGGGQGKESGDPVNLEQFKNDFEDLKKEVSGG